MGARPVVVAAVALAVLTACTSAVPSSAPTRSTRPASRAALSPTATHETVSRQPRSSQPRSSQPRPSRHGTARASSSKTAPAPPAADRLPVSLPTDSARQVITVVAGAEADTQGRVRAWRKVPGGWRPVGPPLAAWLGSDGMTPHPNESLSAVPMGSFTLTQAFGHDPDPGTRLPYRQTTPADWWISQPGADYNTEQHCWSNCPFTQGSPNEHLYYETPYYNYAVVIDYNTRNSATGVRQGAGSAFFLHVSVGAPTQGCVAIDQSQLVRIMRWLRPADHPRILIGTA